MEFRERAAAWTRVHEGELVDDIRRLVEVKSVTMPDSSGYPYGRGCAEVLDHFLNIGTGWGFKTVNNDYHCGSILLKGLGDGFEVGLWSHLDVVEEGKDWIYPPYECRRVGEFLVGRGTQDNKGPAMDALYAMRCLREIGATPSFDIRLIGGCNEEAGMADIPYYLSHNPAPGLSIFTDCGFPVCYGEKGIFEAELTAKLPKGGVLLDISGGSVSNVVPDAASMTLRADSAVLASLKCLPESIGVERYCDTVTLRARGVSGHVAFPNGAVNAIGILCGAAYEAGLDCGQESWLLASLARICGDGYGEGFGIACEDDISGRLTCSGSVVRRRADRLYLTLDIRYPITIDGNTLLPTLEESARFHGFGLRVGKSSPPHCFDRQSPVITTLLAAYQRVTGDGESLPYVMGGGTYARMLPNAVGFGPGLPADYSSLDIPVGRGGCHGPDEAQSIPNLLTAIQVYVLAMLGLEQIL